MCMRVCVYVSVLYCVILYILCYTQFILLSSLTNASPPV